MDLIQALVLGLVQGLTEFLPISSSAHLIIVPWLFGWTDPAITSLQFDVALHMGTLIAVLVYFAADWRRFISAFVRSVAERRIGDDPDRRVAWFILLATIPGAIVGLLAESKIEDLFHEPANLRTGLTIIAVMMIVVGGLLLIAERVGKHLVQMSSMRLNTALAIGFAQAFAVIPGVSRSGSTITAGLFVGLTREAAARFSFLMATPIILGAGLKNLYELIKLPGGLPANQQLGFLVGFGAAAISGFLCIFFLLRYLQRNSTVPFIWYRFFIGLMILALLFLGFRA